MEHIFNKGIFGNVIICHTTLFIVLFIAEIASEPLWIWTKGCWVTKSTDFLNQTENTPYTCFHACGKNTSTFALQGDLCSCNPKTTVIKPASFCKPCDGNKMAACGHVAKGYWSLYKRADIQQLTDHGIDNKTTGCVVYSSKESFSVENCSKEKRGLCKNAFSGHIVCSANSKTWSTDACDNIYDKLVDTFTAVPKTPGLYSHKYWIGLFSVDRASSHMVVPLSSESVSSPTPIDFSIYNISHTISSAGIILSVISPTNIYPTSISPICISSTNLPSTCISFTDKSPTSTSPTHTSPTSASPTDISPTSTSSTDISPTSTSPTDISLTSASPTDISPTYASPTDISPSSASPTDISPTSASPTDISPTSASPTDISPTTTSRTDISPTSASPKYISPTSASPTDISPTSTSPTDISPTSASPTDISPTTTSRTEISPTSASPTDISPTSTSSTDISPTSTSPTDISLTSASPTDISPTSASPDISPTSASPTDISPTTASRTGISPTSASRTDISPTSASPTDISPTSYSPTDISPPSTSPTDISPTSSSPTDISSTSTSPTDISPTSTFIDKSSTNTSINISPSEIPSTPVLHSEPLTPFKPTTLKVVPLLSSTGRLHVIHTSVPHTPTDTSVKISPSIKTATKPAPTNAPSYDFMTTILRTSETFTRKTYVLQTSQKHFKTLKHKVFGGSSSKDIGSTTPKEPMSRTDTVIETLVSSARSESSNKDKMVALTVVGTLLAIALVVVAMLAVHVRRSMKVIQMQRRMTTMRDCRSMGSEETVFTDRDESERCDDFIGDIPNTFSTARRADLHVQGNQSLFSNRGRTVQENKYVLY